VLDPDVAETEGGGESWRGQERGVPFPQRDRFLARLERQERAESPHAVAPASLGTLGQRMLTIRVAHEERPAAGGAYRREAIGGGRRPAVRALECPVHSVRLQVV